MGVGGLDFGQFKEKYQLKEVTEEPNNVPEVPLVSVLVQTYQHKAFIKDCLDGILFQETDFEFEILLGDDDSTDGTREICMEYAKKYPNKIRLFLHHRANNIAIGGQPTGRFNFIYNLFSANGKYIALCEGDDYWTDSFKLKKQVDFLKENKDCGVCFHNAYVANDTDISNELVYKQNIAHKIGLCEYINTSIYAKTCTVLIRYDNSVLEGVNDTPVEYLCDSTLMPLCLLNDKYCFYLDENMAIYRKHVGGIWSLKKEKEVLGQVQKLQKYQMNKYGSICAVNQIRNKFLNSTFKLIMYSLIQMKFTSLLGYITEYKKYGGRLVSKLSLINIFQFLKNNLR